MAIVINGSGTVTGLSVGGLPDGTVDSGTIATGTIVDADVANVAASKLTGALPAISGASLTNLPSKGKNMVINGAMNVAQRGTSKTGYTAGGYYTCDRWKHDKDGSTGTYTMTQEADAPVGFKNSLKVNCTTAGSSGDYDAIHNKIEAQDLSHLAYGTSSAKSITLSFWVKVSQTGTMQFNLLHYADAGTRQISYLYTINTADTWEKKTITFAGDTVRANDDDNTQGFILEWFLNSYGGRTGSSVLTSWGSYTNAARFEGATIQIGDSTSDTWQITGVQLEVGDTATDFEHRSYGEELALCQRYYYLHATKEGGAHPIGSAAFQTANFADFNIHFPTSMRTNPSLEYVSGTDYYSVYANNQLDHFSTFAFRNSSPNGAQIYTNGGMEQNIPQGVAGIAYTRNDNAFMAFTAEL